MNAAQRRSLTPAQHRYWGRWFDALLAQGYSKADARDQADRMTQREINRLAADAERRATEVRR